MRKLISISIPASVIILSQAWAGPGDNNGRGRARGPAAKRQAILDSIQPLIDKKFSHVNSSKDFLEGYVTHTKKDGDRYVGYVYLIWGDLNDEIPGVSSKWYSNWNGEVKVASGTAEVVKEFQFDDGSPEPGTKLAEYKTGRARGRGQIVAKGKTAINRAARHKNPAVARLAVRRTIAAFNNKLKSFDAETTNTIRDKRYLGPEEGSGRDAIVPEPIRNRVVWQAGVVGIKDGLLIRLVTVSDRPHVKITAGKFSTVHRMSPQE